jgi:error-prone DNA polymerase
MDILARWRERGKWWDNESEKDFIRYLDDAGSIREEERCLIYTYPGKRLPKKVAELPAYTIDYMLRPKRASISFPETAKEERVVHLHCLSAYSFGRSAIKAEDIPVLARLNRMPAVALTDYFSLTGVVDFCRTAKTLGVKPIIGATLEIDAGGQIVLLAKNHDGYRNLSRLITHCHLHHERLFPLFELESYREQTDGIVCLTGGHNGPINRLLIHKDMASAKRLLNKLRERFETYVEIEQTFQPWEIAVNRSLIELAKSCDITAVAGGPITHAARDEFEAQDAMICVETLCTVEEVMGRKPRRSEWPERSINSERYFRSPEEARDLFDPALLEASYDLSQEFIDDPLPPRPNFPAFCNKPETLLRETVIKNAQKLYPHITVEHKYRINGELDRVCELGYASHFLAIWEACRWAKSEGISYSARGSAVDSAIAYCLELTRIDAIKHNLHFDRFLPDDGSKKPDIDVDFEAARRDDVRNFLGRRYGKENVATVAAIATYQGRGIVRMVGKALMIPEETLGYLAKRLHGSIGGRRLEEGIKQRPELRDSGIPIERFNLLFKLAETIDGLPRHIGAHSSGVVITDTPICETVPVMESGREGVQIIQWDKYSAKHFFNKLDILCLRGHDVISHATDELNKSHKEFAVDEVPMEDPGIFDYFKRGDLVGIPQGASPAMRQAHIRLRTENIHDVSLVQAGIRPGVGGAVKINELIRRRRSGDKRHFSHPLFEAILGLSYGIIVFQEQVDQLLQAFCGYSPGEAEDIREGIHKQRAESWGDDVKSAIVRRCIERGFSETVAAEVLELVSGFKGYGFAQGHALAFADLSIRCVYCQQQYPAEYFAALLSSQPAGYYGPGTIANEARNKGVRILPIDVNASENFFCVRQDAIRVGLMQQFGLSKPTRDRILSARRPFSSICDFCRRTSPNADELENLILSGALDSLHSNRRELLWAIPQTLEYMHAAGTGGLCSTPEPKVFEGIQDFSAYEKAVLERSMLGLDIEKHLMAYERGRIRAKSGLTCAQAREELHDGQPALVVGHAMRLRFPPTASGRRIVFFDLEDETGMLNVTVFDETYQRDGHAIICSPFVTLRGIAQERDGHMAFLAQRVFPYTPRVDKSGFAVERKAVHSEDFIHRAGR